MLKGILLSALFSGVLLGACLTAMHAFTVYPIIVKAEMVKADSIPHGHDLAHGIQTRVPYAESIRLLFAYISNTVASIAFAIFLSIGFTLFPFAHWRAGAYWGMAGLTAVFIIPAVIYGPTLPGSIEADLFIRQVWWVASVEASVIGIALAVFPQSVWIKLQGGLLIGIVFFIGAPPASIYLQTPESLVNQFYVVTLVTNSIYWLMLGVVTAYFFKRCVLDQGGLRAG